jgi:hypothetical protein
MINELRIGNYILAYSGGAEIPVKVTGLMDGVIYHEETPIGATHGGILNPLPLTEDWIKRLGFERGCLDMYHIYHHLGDVGITYRRAGDYFEFDYIYNPASIPPPKNRPRIQYVHQLQNLVHALTGKELTLSE